MELDLGGALQAVITLLLCFVVDAGQHYVTAHRAAMERVNMALGYPPAASGPPAAGRGAAPRPYGGPAGPGGPIPGRGPPPGQFGGYGPPPPSGGAGYGPPGGGPGGPPAPHMAYGTNSVPPMA